MNYNIGLVQVTANGSAPVLPNEFVNVRTAIQARIDADNLPLPVGRIRDRWDKYAEILETAFNNVLPIPNLGAPEGYTLAKRYRPSVVLPGGHWDYSTDGFSLQFGSGAPQWVPADIDGATYYLTIAPRPKDPAISTLVARVLAEEASTVEFAGASTCKWTLENDTEVSVTGVTLFLSHTRSRLLHVEGNPGKSRTTPSTTYDHEQAMCHIDLQALVQPGATIELTWIYKGDPPHVRAHTWWTLPDPDSKTSSAGSTVLPKVIPRNDRVSLSKYARDKDTEFAMRVKAIALIPPPTQKFHSFFADLDQQTQPPPGTIIEFGLLTGYLRSRYILRAEAIGFDESLPIDVAELASWRVEAENAANLVERIVRAHFTNLNGDLELEKVAEAFELFAGGQLTDFDTHGAPNGVNFFAFCEFAILCVELGHQVPFWSDLIPIFARTSEIFARCYHEPCGTRTSCAYRVAHNPTGARGFSDLGRAQLRLAWQEVAPPIEGFARIVHAALDDELFRGPAPLFRLVDKYDGVAPRCPSAEGCRWIIDERVMPKAKA